MDLNYFLARHQVSLICADAAANVEARLAHLGLAATYANRIRDMQEALGAAARLDA